VLLPSGPPPSGPPPRSSSTSTVQLDLAPHLAAAHLGIEIVEIVQRTVVSAASMRRLRGTRLLGRLAQQRPEPRTASGLASELARKGAAPPCGLPRSRCWLRAVLLRCGGSATRFCG
jgi:hypothetical protein